MGGLQKTGILKAVVIMIVFHLAALSLAQAEEKNCAELSQDLRAMQNAQHQLLAAFEQKTAGLAATFDIHAENLQKALKRSGSLKKTDFQGLRKSATALRKHQIKETDLVTRFEKASALLLDQVQACLAKTPSISSNKSVADTSAKN
jgi:thioredoxin-related protein